MKKQNMYKTTYFTSTKTFVKILNARETDIGWVFILTMMGEVLYNVYEYFLERFCF
jgi:hypothetical protein